MVAAKIHRSPFLSMPNLWNHTNWPAFAEGAQPKRLLMSTELQALNKGVRREAFTRDTVTINEEDAPLIEKLSASHREILLAKGNYKEIGHNLNVPIGTVRSRLHRAREALQRLRQESAAQLH
jgi:hypothetical protein